MFSLSGWISSAIHSWFFFSLLQKASKLTKQIVILEDKNKSQEEEITEYQKQLEALCSTCEELKAKVDSRISAEEHLAVVNDLKRCEFIYGAHMEKPGCKACTWHTALCREKTSAGNTGRWPAKHKKREKVFKNTVLVFRDI